MPHFPQFHLLLLGWILSSLFALRAESSPSLNFQRYDSTDGLPAAHVRRILQDSRGFIWLATNDGLVRHDGQSFLLFRHSIKQDNGLPNSSIWDIVEDQHANLWITTAGGLVRWLRNEEKFVPVALTAENGTLQFKQDTRRLCLDKRQRLWICTNTDGLQRIDAEGSQPLRIPLKDGSGTPIRNSNVESLFIDAKGDLWIGTWNSGLLHCDSEGTLIHHYTFAPVKGGGSPENSIRDLAEDAEHKLWIATEAGLHRLDPQTHAIQSFQAQPDDSHSLGANFIEDVFVDKDNTVWVGTSFGGLCRYDRSSGIFIQYRHDPFNTRSIQSDIVRHIYQDSNGDLWLGHYPSGLSYAKQSNSAFQLVKQSPGEQQSLLRNHVTSIHEDPSGILWITTEGGGVNRWDRSTGHWTHYTHARDKPKSLSINTAYVSLMDREGMLWVGTWSGGLNRLNPATGDCERFQTTPGDPHSLSHRHVKDILQDHDGRLWICTDGGGINRFQPATRNFQRYVQAQANLDTRCSDIVWCFLELRDQTILAGTQAGLVRYDEDTDRWVRYLGAASSEHPLNTLAIVDILESSDSELWFATANDGIYRMDRPSGKLTHLGTEQGLPGESIRSLLQDKLGYVWISTNNGLARLDPRSLRCWTYGIENGLQSPLFVRHSRLRSRNGELFFGGPEGLNIVTPQLVLSDVSSPNVVLTELHVFNQAVKPGQPASPLTTSITETRSLRLPAALSVVSLQFSALSFGSTRRPVYEYRLEGFDEAWRSAGVEQRATYTNLNPGAYLFHFRAASADGTWTSTGKPLAIVVVPPFYRTAWFNGLAILAFVASTVLLTQRIAHRRLRQRLQEAEHARELALEKQKALEQEANYEHQLAQIQKMNSIGRLAGGVAHDLNNMLLPILGYSELAILDLPPDSPARESLIEITRAAERSRDLVRQLLAFARKQALEMKVTDLNLVVRDFMNMLRRTLHENIRIETRLADSLPSVKADARQIEQIILNLAINAQDAMPNGGALFITTESLVLTEGFIGGDEKLVPGPYVTFTVSDTGTGIPAHILPHILEPFFTTKGAGKGTGLGLATVYGIVKQHSGYLKIYSEEGKGTSMRIYLPAIDAKAEAPRAAEAPSLDARGHETILITEDDPQVRQLSRQVLEKAGYTVFEAPNSLDAIKLVENTAAPIDLLLTDIILPDLNGKELYQRLSEKQPSLRVLYMSGYTADVITHHGVLHEDIQFVQKPFNIAVLLQKIRQVLDAKK